MRKWGRSEREIRLAEIADVLNIKPLVNRRDPGILSGGEKQKVALARALAPRPDVLLLDEPLHSLDYSSRELIYDTLRGINEKLGITVLHVTHDHIEARALAHRIGIVNNGKMVQTGRPGDVFRQPETRFAAEFLGAENVFHGQRVGKSGSLHLVKVGDTVLKARLNDETGSVYFCVRPENINVLQKPNSPHQAIRESPGSENVLQGTLREVSDRGIFAKLVISSRGVEFISYLHKDELRKLSPELGMPLHFGFGVENICILRGD